MKRLAWFTIMAAIVLAGCGGDGEPKPDPNAPPPPPEPTASEISSELRSSLKPLADAILATQGNPPVEVREQALAQVRQTQQKFMGKEHLPAAQASVVREIQDQIAMAEQQELWGAIDDLTAAWAVFDPTNPRIATINERAQRELSRPRPEGNPSFFTDVDKDMTAVFVTVFYPDRNERESFQVREGEDFANGRLRLKQIIGRQQGVRIVDNEDGKTYELRRSR